MKTKHMSLGATALFTVMLASGCGPRSGTVSGQVLYANKPLPGGIVSFVPVESGANPASITLSADGRYEVTLTEGLYQIVVDNREQEARSHKAPPRQVPPRVKLPPQPKADAPPPDKAAESGRFVRIPEKYQSAATSGLSYTVTAGPQTHDIELK